MLKTSRFLPFLHFGGWLVCMKILLLEENSSSQRSNPFCGASQLKSSPGLLKVGEPLQGRGCSPAPARPGRLRGFLASRLRGAGCRGPEPGSAAGHRSSVMALGKEPAPLRAQQHRRPCRRRTIIAFLFISIASRNVKLARLVTRERQASVTRGARARRRLSPTAGRRRY